ncbi:LysE family translocator [Solicola gregarius]|uniref:LysE family translocator n=1 Tax=Solicola gregarius TaxID=2908642 RepID=A0AA46TIW6_9ACTN|nr:LysE family translocator [Solicola gregarius]UYM06051.1 LysE family translocator [Solicola gregarius]
MTAFAVAALLLIMVPGPDQALITRNSLVGGVRGGIATMTGGVLGVAVHATAAAAGLSALLLTSATAFTVLKVAGTAYLLWLGCQLLRTAGRFESADPDLHDLAERPGASAYLRQGFLSNALNPKVALFFVTFLPQFLSSDTASPHGEAMLFSASFAALYVLWFGLYVAVVDRIGRVLRRPRVRIWIERTTGTILCVVAIRLATTSH